MAFKEIEPGIWKPEKERDSITGVFIKSEKIETSLLYHLEVEANPIAVWGSVILDQRMAIVKPGDKIRITFKGLGEAKPGKNAPKLFKVEVDDETEDGQVEKTTINEIPVAEVTAN